MATRRDAAIWISVPVGSVATTLATLWFGSVSASQPARADAHDIEKRMDAMEMRFEKRMDRLEDRLNRYVRAADIQDRPEGG